MGKGKLLFKGEKPKKKKHKSKHSKKENDDETENITEASTSLSHQSASTHTASNTNRKNVDSVVAAGTASSVNTSSSAAPTIRKGTGKITTSGTVVTGYDTKFEKEVANGDAILCIINGQEELRVITMRLSNVSLNLSSPFSQSLSTPISFQYIRKPRDAAKERKEARKKELETKQEREQHAYDLYRSEALVYREKTETGSYRIKKESVQGGVSRGDLLELRAKKTSDKYC